jgi:ubiquitin conjugation factor E4 B
MAGPKSSQLKVEGNVQLMVEKYGFDPKVVLSEIAKIYLNLMNKQNFITAIARDGRSYRPELFKQAADLLRQHKLTPEEDLRRWDRLRKQVQEAKEADQQAEEDLGEIPDDFLGTFTSPILTIKRALMSLQILSCTLLWKTPLFCQARRFQLIDRLSARICSVILTIHSIVCP